MSRVISANRGFAQTWTKETNKTEPFWTSLREKEEDPSIRGFLIEIDDDGSSEATTYAGAPRTLGLWGGMDRGQRDTALHWRGPYLSLGL